MLPKHETTLTVADVSELADSFFFSVWRHAKKHDKLQALQTGKTCNVKLKNASKIYVIYVCSKLCSIKAVLAVLACTHSLLAPPSDMRETG